MSEKITAGAQSTINRAHVCPGDTARKVEPAQEAKIFKQFFTAVKALNYALPASQRSKTDYTLMRCANGWAIKRTTEFDRLGDPKIDKIFVEHTGRVTAQIGGRLTTLQQAIYQPVITEPECMPSIPEVASG